MLKTKVTLGCQSSKQRCRFDVNVQNKGDIPLQLVVWIYKINKILSIVEYLVRQCCALSSKEEKEEIGYAFDRVEWLRLAQRVEFGGDDDD